MQRCRALRVFSFVSEIKAFMVPRLSHRVLTTLADVLGSFVAPALFGCQAVATTMTAVLVFKLSICEDRFAFGILFGDQTLPRCLCPVQQSVLTDHCLCIVALSVLLVAMPAHTLFPGISVSFTSASLLFPQSNLVRSTNACYLCELVGL